MEVLVAFVRIKTSKNVQTQKREREIEGEWAWWKINEREILSCIKREKERERKKFSQHFNKEEETFPKSLTESGTFNILKGIDNFHKCLSGDKNCEVIYWLLSCQPNAEKRKWDQLVGKRKRFMSTSE